MDRSDVYKMLFQCMGECWEWAYDKPENAVAYFDGLWTMADKVANRIGSEAVTLYTGLENLNEADLKRFGTLGKEAST